MLYSKRFVKNSSNSDESLTFCGFQKPHPHIDVSFLRLGFVNEVDQTTVISYLVKAVEEAVGVYDKIATYFEKDN